MRLAGLRGKSFRDGNLAAGEFPGDATAQRRPRVVCANDELHERTEAPNSGSAENVQAGDGGFKALAQARESTEATDGLGEFGCEEIVLGDVDAIAGAEKNVIGGALSAVVKFDLHALACHASGNNCPAELHRHALQPGDKPARAGRANGAAAEPILDRARELANQIRPRHDLADARGANVGGSVEDLGKFGTQTGMNGSGEQATEPANILGASDNFNVRAS